MKGSFVVVISMEGNNIREISWKLNDRLSALRTAGKIFDYGMGYSQNGAVTDTAGLQPFIEIDPHTEKRGGHDDTINIHKAAQTVKKLKGEA